MDEPDAFLSSRAQQDLLKIFEEVSTSEDGKPASQVVYVTHSPFLIDKNHAERIRVLDKGSDYEGTRVVKSVSKNHYEPLRSAFGSFVAETVYISHCNLMVEGPVDQVLLAGASTYLRTFGIASKRESLDLNEVTIVPAEGATNIPYLTYLDRGRDSEQPAVIVLLDSDQEGNQARKELTEKGYGPRKKPPLKKEFVLSDEIRKGIGGIRKDYKLHINLGERVENYEQFRQDVECLEYLGKFASQGEQEGDEISREDGGLANSLPENPDSTDSSSDKGEPATASLSNSGITGSRKNKKITNGNPE